jgi:type IV pilus assembly protein PilE
MSSTSFLDNKSYLNACLVIKPIVNNAKAFTIDCADTAATYSGTATGKTTEGMGGFAYSIDQTNTRTTTSMPTGWGPAQGCGWSTRKDGSCT